MTLVTPLNEMNFTVIAYECMVHGPHRVDAVYPGRNKSTGLDRNQPNITEIG
jgi:hypothetical protein